MFQSEAEDITDEEISFVIKHLDTFLISGQRLLTKIINNSKHFVELMDCIETLAESQLSKVKLNICIYDHCYPSKSHCLAK